ARRTTSGSMPHFGNSVSRPACRNWRPRRDEEVSGMRSHALATGLMLIPLGVSPVLAQAVGVREVTASERSVIPLTTKIRYTTMIVLPDDEEILDVVVGDRDFWVISATQN